MESMNEKLLAERHKIVNDVHATIQKINEDMAKDVFAGRFWIEITKQSIELYDDESGWDCTFWITFHDKKCPERDFEYIYSPHYIIYSGFLAGGRHMDTDLNDFIIKSDFWTTYKANANS